LAVVGVLASVIGAFYYIRIVKVMYVDDETQALDQSIARSNTLIALTSAVMMVGFVFMLSFLRETIQTTIPFVVFVAG
jgi:NADH-quinone oxidoreductase subunit N